MLFRERVIRPELLDDLPLEQKRGSLADLDKGNLKFTTDFRAVYSTVMDGWLGAPAEKLLGARFQNLGFLGSGAAG